MASSPDALAALRARILARAGGVSPTAPASDLRARILARTGKPAPPVDDRTWVGKAADTVIPTALRVVPAIVGGAVGAAAGLPALGLGSVAGGAAGGAAGSAVGETAAEAYEVARGLRPEMNLTQVATQTALGAVPVVGRAGSVARTMALRGAQGAALGGVGAYATERADGRDPSLAQVATGVGLGTVLGAGGGAVEARLAASRVPAPRPPTSPADEKLAALIASQHAPAPVSPIRQRIRDYVTTLRTSFIDDRDVVARTMREHGADPLREDAATNPVKALELARGGSTGVAEADATEIKAILDEARAAGLADDFEAHANLTALEHGATTLSMREGRALRERILERAARTMGREPRQAEFTVPRADGVEVPLVPERPAEPVQDSLFDTLAATPSTARTATDDLRTTAPTLMRGGRGTVVANESGRVVVQGNTPRRVKFRTVGEPDESELDDLVDELAELAGDGKAAPGAEGAKAESLRGPQQLSLLNDPTTQSPRTQSQPLLKGLPTPSEIDAINARIDRAKIHYPDITTARGRTERLSPETIADIAQAHGLSDAQVKAFADAAHEKGLPEWYVRASVQDAARRGTWALEAGAALKLDDELQAGTALPRGITPTDIQALAEDWHNRTGRWADLTEDQRAKVVGYTERLLELGRAAMRDAAKSGVLTPEARELFVRPDSGHIPLFRQIEKTAEQIGLVSNRADLPTQHIIRKLMGSERDTQHPGVAMALHLMTIRQETARNRAMQTLHAHPAFREVLQELPKGVEPPKGIGVLKYLRDGEVVTLAAPKALVEALTDADPHTASVLGKVAASVAHVFKQGATTANLLFSVPNVARDVSASATLTNRSRAAGVLNPAIWKELGQAFADVARESPEYLQFLRSGAAFSGYQKNLEGAQKFLSIKANGLTFKNPLDAVKWFNGALEESTKLMSYRHLKSQQATQGWSDAEVAWITRNRGGSPDFAKAGKIGRQLNVAFPFLNATIQSIDRLQRYAQQHPKEAGYAAIATIGKLAGLYAYNKSFTDSDGTPSWDRISPREKQTNWILFIPGQFEDPDTGIRRQNYLKFPSSHEIDVIRAPFSAMMDDVTRTPTDLANSVLRNLPLSPQLEGSLPDALSSTLISGANPIAKVPLEIFANKDTYRGIPIEPKRLEGVAPIARFTAQTSPTAKLLSQVTAPAFGVGPMKIEHAVKTGLGGVGRSALAALDAVTSPEGGSATSALAPLVSRFVGTAGASVDAVAQRQKNVFYKTLVEAQQVRQTYNLNRREGRPNPPPSPRQQALYQMAPRLQTLSQQMAELRRAGDKKTEREALIQIQQALASIPED